MTQYHSYDSNIQNLEDLRNHLMDLLSSLNDRIYKTESELCKRFRSECIKFEKWIGSELDLDPSNPTLNKTFDVFQKEFHL